MILRSAIICATLSCASASVAQGPELLTMFLSNTHVPRKLYGYVALSVSRRAEAWDVLRMPCRS